VKRLILVLALLPWPALADAVVDQYRGPVDACYAQANRSENLDACYGLLTAACVNAAPQGETTLGMSQCLQAELAYWDEWLNREYGVTMAQMRERDTYHRANSPQYAVGEDLLRAAQRAWVVFRDADCQSRHSVWAEGSIGQIIYPSCLAERTFERVQDLIRLREN
jgi:uncharacterized protein YecT (DUF1311 family)